jgi:peptidoglycan/xylan/chitin deacetylase (PgdA/CDA1 family)
LLLAVLVQGPVLAQGTVCSKPLYLTFDTGHMGVAQFIADTLSKYQVKATFFAANERTLTGQGSLSDEWQPFWRQLVRQGHQLASHTYDHWIWRADVDAQNFQVRPTAGALSGQTLTVTEQAYCTQLKSASQRLQAMTGAPTLPLFRAPGGKTSAALLQVAKRCGYAHVPWSPAGFLGDELPSDKYPNALLLRQALANIRSGDILLAHLGIWSRQDPWAKGVLDPLLAGLMDKGFCFQTLDQHPHYRTWIETHSFSSNK